MKSKAAVGWAGFALGALTFLAAHAVEAMRWTDWFGGAHEPWFLNAGAATVFTLGCVFAVSTAVALLDASVGPVKGITIAAGAFTAMTVVLFLKPGGAGTIFPIVMALGGVLILISSTLGALIGREVRRAVKGR